MDARLHLVELTNVCRLDARFVELTNVCGLDARLDLVELMNACGGDERLDLVELAPSSCSDDGGMDHLEAEAPAQSVS